MDLNKHYEISGKTKKRTIIIQREKRKQKYKSTSFFFCSSAFNRTHAFPLLTPSLAWNIDRFFFFKYAGNNLSLDVFCQDDREEGISTIWCSSSFFNFYYFYSYYFNSSGNAQRSQDAILLLLVSSDNHLSRKHLFISLLSLPVWGTGQMWNCIRFFIFISRFYIELCLYPINDAIILSVCNICVEIWLYIILLYVSVVFSIPDYFSWIGWCS